MSAARSTIFRNARCTLLLVELQSNKTLPPCTTLSGTHGAVGNRKRAVCVRGRTGGCTEGRSAMSTEGREYAREGVREGGSTGVVREGGSTGRVPGGSTGGREYAREGVRERGLMEGREGGREGVLGTRASYAESLSCLLRCNPHPAHAVHKRSQRYSTALLADIA